MTKEEIYKKLRIPTTKEDFLTIFEKGWRDWLLYPVTTFLRFLGVTPNILSVVGLLLIASSVYDYFYPIFSLKINIIIIFSALITDMLDGSMARNHNMISVSGAWLDRVRDGIWITWTSFLLYANGLLSLEWVGILFSFDAVLGYLYGREMIIIYLRQMEKFPNFLYHFFEKYTMERLRTDVFGRINFAVWAVGYIFFLIYLLSPADVWIQMGNALLVVAIVFGALRLERAYLHEEAEE